MYIKYGIHIKLISPSSAWRQALSQAPRQEQSGPGLGALEHHGSRALPGLHQGSGLAGAGRCAASAFCDGLDRLWVCENSYKQDGLYEWYIYII